MTLSAPWRFELAIDWAARRWLKEHPKASRLFIAFESTRLRRFGVRIRDIQIRSDVARSRHGGQATAWLLVGEMEGRPMLLDACLYECMPRQIPLTTRGVGPFRHLELDLNGEQWAGLLYPAPR